jgi:ribosomal protein L11 methyltransferase
MQFETKKHRVGADSLRENALDIVATSSAKTTPSALEKRLFKEYALNKRQIKAVIRNLVAGGELAYTYEYGSTFLERSFAKPVRVSKHIVLQPPGHHHSSDPKDVVVKIKPGASFGAGNHPTTRLAIKGIEFVLLGDRVVDKRNDTRVLDIGTGSGVLLITAILCGMKSGLGVDIDVCARVEAAENVRINALEDRVAISGQSLADIHQRFSVILANLRFPSLKKMLSQINERADTNCFLIFSGIRDYELDDLLKVYQQIQFEMVWTDNELGWSGVVLRRHTQKN